MIRVDSGCILGCVDTRSLRKFLNVSAGLFMIWESTINLFIYDLSSESFGSFSTARAVGDNCLPGICHLLNCLLSYIIIGLLFNKIVNFWREENRLNVVYDIESSILKVKSEEKLGRGEIKITQLVKLELNLKPFFYSFLSVTTKRKYGIRIKCKHYRKKNKQLKAHSLLLFDFFIYFSFLFFFFISRLHVYKISLAIFEH